MKPSRHDYIDGDQRLVDGLTACMSEVSNHNISRLREVVRDEMMPLIRAWARR